MSSNSPQLSQRLYELDAVRGLIIILMALDHANHFIGHTHPSLEMWGGPFPTYTNSTSFLIRFVTHLAAPGFSFLLGIGIVLFASSRMKLGWTKYAIRRHLWLRGGFLILLQFYVVNRAWELYPESFPQIYIGVLIALGGALIIGSFLLWLPRHFLIILAIIVPVIMEVTHPGPKDWATTNPGWIELLFLLPGGDLKLWSNYPVFAWIEFALLGMVYGSLINDDREKAIRYAFPIGTVLVIGFLILRSLDGFGNIRPITDATWIGFLNLVKYPPSLTFFMLTMGFTFLLIGFFSKVRSPIKPLLVFGRVPLFFYVLHLFLYAIIGAIVSPNGTSTIAMLMFWVLGLVLTYPMCMWFDRLKRKQGEDSLIRLF